MSANLLGAGNLLDNECECNLNASSFYVDRCCRILQRKM